MISLLQIKCEITIDFILRRIWKEVQKAEKISLFKYSAKFVFLQLLSAHCSFCKIHPQQNFSKKLSSRLANFNFCEKILTGRRYENNQQTGFARVLGNGEAV
jgi:hypothetical protein